MPIPPLEAVTLGEVYRSQTKLERTVADGFAALSSRLDNLVSREEHSAHIESLEDRVDDLENSRTWLTRAVAGGFLAAFVGIIINATGFFN